MVTKDRVVRAISLSKISFSSRPRLRADRSRKYLTRSTVKGKLYKIRREIEIEEALHSRLHSAWSLAEMPRGLPTVQNQGSCFFESPNLAGRLASFPNNWSSRRSWSSLSSESPRDVRAR